MCGIAGLINYKNRDLLLKMNSAQVHRGPDYGGDFWDGDSLVGFAMRRLSIVDIESGLQPMTNEDKSIVLVFNGEIFNAKPLRSMLLDKGHVFKTKSSDTEVLVHLYEEYEADMLNMLNGMFAFAIYDKEKRIVFVARDHMGIKPLHYAYNGRQLAFASEIKSLRAAGIVSNEIDRRGLWHYMSLQCVPAPLTIYRDIKVLPSAHYFIYHIDTLQLDIKRYWDCMANRQIYNGAIQDINEYVRSNIEEAFERWTMSDVPLACSLSGGLDSSIIAAVVSRKHELHAYSLGFEDFSAYDERELAKKLILKYNIKHEEIILTPAEVLAELPEMIRALDSPYAGGIPSWFVFQRICGHEKVAFNGTGGDELFGNYSKWLRYEHPLARLRIYKQFVQFEENASEFLKYPSGSIYHKYMSENMKRNIILSQKDNVENTSRFVERLFAKCPSKDWRDRVPYVDFRIQLPEEFLMMIDRFSMHFSIEARVPFLDRDLVEKILGIPGNIRTKKYNAKYLLKEAMRDFLPAEHLQAPKRGFVLPCREWLKKDLKQAVLDLCTGEYLKKQGIFQESLEKELIKPFYEGRDYLMPLVWTVLMFQFWHNEQACAR